MIDKENQENNEFAGDGEKLSFGMYLKKARLENGLSIDDVLNQTRISKYVIQQIEEENRKNLPEDVFLKGFLKAFAETVGVDPDDVLMRYKDFCSNDEDVVEKNDDEHLDNPVISNKVVVCCILIAILILFSLVFFSSSKDDSLSKEVIEERDVVVLADEENTTTEEKKTDIISEELLLEIVCVEETTLKISSDGGIPTEHNLQPEDILELKADKQYNILIDNTCGVTLFLNNDPVVVPGKCGQTVNIQLP